MFSYKQIPSRLPGLILLALLVTAPTAFAATESNPHARDLKLLAQWFAGQFDNEEQIWFERDP